MSECSNSSSMTGSTKTGLLQPQEDSLSLLARTSPFEGSATPDNNSSARRCRRHQLHRKMTPVPPAVQPIQLTPLWEHVVRTRRFPSEVDTRSTFIEISERLRDPEWEVRQHALRVLMDVLPTLNAEIVDQVMQPVVPELVNNLGHAAPAVRKGALDTLRVYLVHSRDREEMMKNILRDGLNRSDSHDAFQTNVTAGVILSAPCLLFPSSSSPRPTASVLKDITIALASRLSQTTHQESLLRSLMKIRDLIGGDEFDRYIENYDEKLKRSLEVLCKVYDVKPGKRNRAKAISLKDGGLDKDEEKDRWESDSDTSGIAEEEDEENEEEEEDDDDDAVSSGIPGRIVLETEIKFDEETAITMTILEEKDRDSEVDETIKNEAATDLEEASSERRKTPRRVHFGGEVVKLRTPDSDDTGSLVTEAPKTRIPLPVSPITRMPGERSSRRPSSQPCSPHLARRRSSRASRSVSSSPKREVHAHNADLSPKKGILARTSERPSEEDQQQRSIGKRRKVAMRERTGAEDVLRGDVTSEELGRAASDQFVEAKKDEERSIRSEPKKSVSLVPEGSNEVEDDQTRLQNAEEAGSKEAIGKNGSPKEKEYGGLPRDPLDVIMGESCVEDEFQNYEFSMRVQERDGAVGAFPDGDKSDAPSKSADSNERKARKKGNAMEVDSSFEIADSIQKDKSVRIKVFASEIDRTSDAEKSDPFPRSEADQDASAIGRLDEIESMKESSTTADKSQEIRPVSEFTGKDQFSTKRVQAPRPITTNSYVERTKVVDRNILKYGDIQRSSRRDDPVNERAMGNGSLTCSSSESEGKVQEPSWEELGLVDQEVLDDLHNKDDWRARVRGLERVASALRTSSALIAIESRLGSLLHAVLGGERSCRVAAAGLSVAKVIVAGVSEDALKRRLSQLAWGLARQGGPHAAQLARIAMLRLRPALFLEQLLQAQCFGARNAKTRENALQLLIFSLVTFPSTEFKVEAVAHKVATMVGDRRRRVRQAALDALAVLAQIYDSEEVLQAGKRASAGRHDGQAMMSAIRARLARRSLPLVSADGLVVYGLQISPTVQIATGPDVDWIVAGSGSVSPGTGRSRGQIIASTTKLEKGRILRDRNTMTRESPWRNRPNFITHGIGLRSKNEHPVAWQIIPHNQDDSCRDEMQESKGRNRVIHDGEKRNFGLKSEERCLHASSNEKRKNSQTDSVIHRESVRNDSTDNGNVQSIVKENTGYKTESRIPVLFSRDRGLNIRSNECNPDVDNNLQITNVKSRGKTKYDEDGTSNKTNSRDDYIGSYEALYRRRKRLQQDALANATPSHKQGTAGRQEQIYLQNNSQNYEKLTKDERSSKSSDGNSKSYRSNSMEGRPYSLSKNVEPPTSSMFPTPTPIYQGQRRFLESQTFKALSPGSSQLTSVYQDIQNLNQQVISNNEKNVFARSKTDRETKDSSSRNAADAQQVPSNTQTNTQSFLGKRVDSPFRRRLRSLSPSQLYDQRRIVRLASNGIKTSMYNIDKAAVNEDEYNEQNKTYCLSEINNYPTEALNKNDDLYQVADFINSKNLESSSSNASARTDQTDPRQSIDRNIFDEDEQRRVNNSNDDSRSSSSRSQNADKAFDVISQKSNLQERGTGRSYAIPISTKESDGSIESTIASMEDDTSKDWSSDEEIKPRSGIEALSSREEFLLLSTSNSNENSDAVDEADNTKEASRRSATSSLSKERSVTNDSSMPSNEFLQFVYSSSSYQEIRPTSPSQRAVSSTKSETAYSINSSSNDSNNFEISSTLKRNLKEQPISSASEYEEAVEYSNLNEERAISSIFTDKDASFQLRDIERSPVVSPTAGSPRIHTVFRSRSNVSVTNTNDSTKTESNISSHSTGNISLFSKESSPLDLREDRTASTDVSFNKMPMQSESFAKIDDIINNISETNIEPSIFKIGIPTVESVESTKKMTSRVPRSIMRTRSSTSKASTSQQPEKTVIKSQLSIQQCFTQLESKDWESTMKGLKSLSQIAKQHPEYLDSCAAGTIGRLLGRHIRNLRSQVARAACIAAGDIFNTQIKGIDQEIDDIVGPLLHRTADTNRFLRSDSNMALDIMVEHLPPHKIIGVIVHHGASHQNSIVRAATARLLSSIVDRVGPEQAMTLPRDVRDKLLCSGARLVIDGNLDARNHAKKMFRKLIHCEGFQRALTDAVPDTTLRHIDKTLKSL